MDLEDQVRAGDIQGALQAVQERVRADPTAIPPRVLLFQLLCIRGDWDRALLQLRTLGELDTALLPLAWTYRSAILAERFREKVFRGQATPHVLGEPVQWTALLLEALRLTATGHAEEGAVLRRRAFDRAPATPGTLDGRPFSWLADGDSRIGPMLELIVDGRYGWAPLTHVAGLRVEAPTDLRDLVWVPVVVRWANEGESVALMPSRYPFSHRREDVDLARSRKTVWEPCGGEFHLGYGQRMWITDRDEHALLDARELRLGTASR